MKKLFPALFRAAITCLAKGTRIKTYSCVSIVFLVGCALDEAHWNAMKMREHVNDYYMDEIMDNLVRAKEDLPFVHVDISTLSSVAGSKLNGNVGGGETRTNTNASMTSVAGIVGTVTRAVMRPFSYSVSPERSDTLTVGASPALAYDEIYNLYFQFLNVDGPGKFTARATTGTNLCRHGDQILSVKGPESWPSEAFVPGTLKKFDHRYYYVPRTYQRDYFQLCMALFKAKRIKPSATKDLKFELDELRNRLD